MIKEKLFTCGKLISDYLHKTKTQTSTYEFNIPASDDKSKLSSNPVYQGSASEMILIQFPHLQSVMNLMKGITGYRGLRKRKRGEDWERIWKRFGDAKRNSQKLEKEREADLPKECLKRFV